MTSTGSPGFTADEQALSEAVDDFGHLVFRSPRAVLKPESIDDITSLVRWAGDSHARVAAKGRGHSVFGRAQAPDGVICDMSSLAAVGLVEDGCVHVEAGATWRDVLARTLPLDLAPPVVPGFLDLSVGGTIAVGGIGSASSRHGAVTDHLRDVELVTGAGQRLTCSPTRSRELYDCVRAGLGQVGIIAAASLRLVPVPGRLRTFRRTYADLSTMLRDARVAAVAPFTGIQGAVAPSPNGAWTYRIETTIPAADAEVFQDAIPSRFLAEEGGTVLDTLFLDDHLTQFDELEHHLRLSGAWDRPHPWLTTFVGDDVVEALVADELSQLGPRALGAAGQIVLSPLGKNLHTPLLRLPAGAPAWAFNIIRFPDTDDPAALTRLVDDNRTIYERVRRAGGFLYPAGSACPMTPYDWCRHFGSAHSALLAAKRRFDPLDVVGNGYDVFS